MKLPVQPRYNLKRYASVYFDNNYQVVMDPTDDQIVEWKAKKIFFIYYPGGELEKVAIDWSKGAIRGSRDTYYSGQVTGRRTKSVSWFDFADIDTYLEEI